MASAGKGELESWLKGNFGPAAWKTLPPVPSCVSMGARMTVVASRAVHWWHRENHDTVLSPTALDLAKSQPVIPLGLRVPVRLRARVKSSSLKTTV